MSAWICSATTGICRMRNQPSGSPLHAASVGQLNGISHVRRTAPVGGQRAVFEATHPTRHVDQWAFGATPKAATSAGRNQSTSASPAPVLPIAFAISPATPAGASAGRLRLMIVIRPRQRRRECRGGSLRRRRPCETPARTRRSPSDRGAAHLVRDQLGLEQHALGRVQGIEVVSATTGRSTFGNRQGSACPRRSAVPAPRWLAAEPGDHREHGLRGQMRAAAVFPRFRGRRELPYVQLPAAIDHEHDAARGLHAGLRRAHAAVLVARRTSAARRACRRASPGRRRA